MSSARRLFALIWCGFAAQLSAADWLQYHGPNGDGTTPETIRTNWQINPPKILWRKPIGPGWSSMAVRTNRIYTQVRRTSTQLGERELCVALDADTGNELWARDVESAVYTDLSGYSDQIDGPRSTPTIDADRVYVLTSYLNLYCMNADTGAVIWHRDFANEIGSTVIPWENAASPLLVGDLIYLNVNVPGQALMAVRKSDGATVWSGQDDVMTHATPVYATIAGVPQVIFLTHSGLVAVTPDAGNVLWRLPFTPSSTSTAASPSVAGQYVHGSSAYGYGTWVARVTANGNIFSATQAGHQQGVFYQLHWATPVQHNGLFYCIPSASPSQARLTCFDPVAGTNRWAQTTVGTSSISFGSVIKANNILVVMTEGGELVLVSPDPEGYTEVAKLKVLNAYCWNRTVISNGRLYARNSALSSEIVALDVSPVVPLAPFNIAAEVTPDGAHIKLTLRLADGGVFDKSDVSRVEIVTATEASPNPWTALQQGFAFDNGAIFTEVALGSEDARYFGAREKTN